MKREILFNASGAGDWVAERAQTTFDVRNDTTISIWRGGQMLGGVIYSHWTGASVTLHIASVDERWITPDLLWVCFHYPFVQLGVSKLIGFVPSYNTHALNFDLKLGFKLIAVIPGVYPAGDLLILTMDKADCRFLNLRPRTLAAGNMVGG